ncbi:MAG: amino acid ABC transporter permease [Proteobacteria bacterium]|nr:amino acid ABC transporter permease [Pseudomonadota bacterium]
MFDVFFANLPYLLKGMLITIEFAFGGIVVGTLLGVGLGILAVVFPSVVGKLITIYVFVIRGIPILVWMFMGYTSLGVLVGDFTAVLIVLILYTSAFVAEIARGAILSVHHGQIESAKSVGMRWPLMLRLVILPQAINISLPALVNNSIMIIKATAYVSVVGVWELSYAAREVVERTLAALDVFLGVMMMYFVICYPLAIIANRLEKRFAFQH